MIKEKPRNTRTSAQRRSWTSLGAAMDDVEVQQITRTDLKLLEGLRNANWKLQDGMYVLALRNDSVEPSKYHEFFTRMAQLGKIEAVEKSSSRIHLVTDKDAPEGGFIARDDDTRWHHEIRLTLAEMKALRIEVSRGAGNGHTVNGESPGR